MSLVYRGDGWNVQYAVAKGARLAAGKGGNLRLHVGQTRDARVSQNPSRGSQPHRRPLDGDSPEVDAANTRNRRLSDWPTIMLSRAEVFLRSGREAKNAAILQRDRSSRRRI